MKPAKQSENVNTVTINFILAILLKKRIFVKQFSEITHVLTYFKEFVKILPSSHWCRCSYNPLNSGNALLAQLVEQATLNRQVIGSIPMQRTFYISCSPAFFSVSSADVAELADAYDLGSYA
jgi:hypothetical protein